MSDYEKSTNFSAKDALPAGSGGPKIISGDDWDTEFAAIQTAIATKYDSDDLADQSEAEGGSASNVLMTPLRTAQYVTARTGGRRDMARHPVTAQGVAPNQTFLSSTYEDIDGVSALSLTADKLYLLSGMVTVVRPGAIDGSFGLKFVFSQTPQFVYASSTFPRSAFNTNGVILTSSGNFTFANASTSLEYFFRGVVKANATTGGTLTPQGAAPSIGATLQRFELSLTRLT